MCKYCDNLSTEYYNSNFELAENIDGSKQDFEVGIAWNPEYDSPYVLLIDGTHTTLEILIKYCPICGKSFYNT